eukprot:UN24133
MDMLFTIGTYVGLGVMALGTKRFLTFVYNAFLRPGQDLKSYGSWAVVTGSTSGIGLGYANELARKGLNVLLISRSQDKLNNVATDITNKHKVQVKTLAIDCANFNTEAQAKVTDVCKDIDVGILINNVGLSYEYPEFFQNVDIARFEKIMSVNNHALTVMTRLLVPQMLKKKKGAIVNVSSAAAVIPHQLMIVYGSSKAYVNNLRIIVSWRWDRKV